MRSVVQKHSAFQNYTGQAVAGKTGTAQESSDRPNHALFIGYAPYEDPEMTIAVRIANGYSSANAAALARDVITYYFDRSFPLKNCFQTWNRNSGMLPSFLKMRRWR